MPDSFGDVCSLVGALLVIGAMALAHFFTPEHLRKGDDHNEK